MDTQTCIEAMTHTQTHTHTRAGTARQSNSLQPKGKARQEERSSQPREPATQKGNSSDCPDPTEKVKEKSSGITQQPRKRKQIDASAKKKAELEASNIAARQLFERSKVQSLEEEVSKLKQQLAEVVWKLMR